MVRLSELKEGQMGRFSFDREEFLVIERSPEDRSSGVTKVYYILSGSTDTFVWDHSNPVVMVTGRGRLETKLIRE
jgi:hypothetical protein